MLQSVFLLLVTALLIHPVDTKLVGYIAKAAYVSANATSFVTYNTSCRECICRAFLSGASSTYVGMNCFRNNQTCALFANYSSTTTVITNLNSTFIFIVRPPSTNATAVFPLVNGVTIAGYGNGSAGTANNALNLSWGIGFGADGSVFVSDFYNHRVMKIQEGNLTGSIVAGTGVSGNSTAQLKNPTEIVVDNASNIYVNDDYNYRVMLWRRNTTFGLIKAGTGVAGTLINKLGTSDGLAVDSQGNIYVVDHGNHRVMKWMANATYGTIIAGVTGVTGNNSTLLNQPYGLSLDEDNSCIYIADLMNHRIQQFRLDGSLIGVTVAGGNGPGSANHQLSSPYAVYVSKITGDIYIADTGNSRIQWWQQGATSGITIVGISGVSGTAGTLLYGPTYVILNKNETLLYVSDGFNHRVRRFELPPMI